jgi:uncharacterized membrane protein
MMSRWQWLLSLLTRRLWFRATLISLLAVAAALLSVLLAPYVPSGLSTKIGADSVDSILNIIASSMLAVTTFSLSTMVAAYASATSSVTPRATRLLIEDTTTQNVLSTFVGAFLYSLVAIITLSMGAYGEQGRVVLFAVTLLVVALIVITLLRWIDYLLRLGRVGETTEAVERAASEAMRHRHAEPYLGGTALSDPDAIPSGAYPVHAAWTGYVQHIDMAALSQVADETRAEVYLVALPGTFVDKNRPLAWTTALPSEDMRAGIVDAFTLGRERSFDQDPRFGMSVLAEIASRALSPAINDPGTAIDVLGRTVRVLSIWAEPRNEREPRFPRVHLPAVTVGELFDDIFSPIARDGAGLAEVQIRLQKALGALARHPDPRFAREAERHALLALSRAEKALAEEDDRLRVRAAASLLFPLRR